MDSLQDSLDKFKKQQEECQSVLTCIAEQIPVTNSTEITPPSTSSSSVSPPIKFSNDIERLQYIHSIRKAPVGSQIKRVTDLLIKKRQALTAEQINEECYVDINSNKDVFDRLTNNPKVTYDGNNRFSYKAKHNLQDKDQLLMLIRQCPDGIAVINLKDAYPTVMEDLESLKAAGDVWLLSNLDPQDDIIVYPNDPKVAIKVDDDIKELYRGIVLPKEMIDIEKELHKHGMKPATNTAERRTLHGFTKPKPKKEEARNHP